MNKEIKEYQTLLQNDLIVNAHTGLPLSPTTTKTRLSDLASLSRIDLDSNLKEELLKNYSGATAEKLFTLVKTVARQFKLKLDPETVRYKAPAKRVETFSPAQVAYIIENYKSLRGRLNRPHLKRILDIMVVALTTGARIGDIQSWTQDNLVEINDQIWLSYVSMKTGTPVELPVQDIALGIFVRYKHTGFLMPKIDSNSNNHLRDVVLKIPILKKSYPFAHIHFLRGSCVTYLLSKGAPEYVVKSITGHTQDSKSFRRYVTAHKEEKLKYITF